MEFLNIYSPFNHFKISLLKYKVKHIKIILRMEGEVKVENGKMKIGTKFKRRESERQ